MKLTYKATLIADVLATAPGRMGPIRLPKGTTGFTDGVTIYADNSKLACMLEFCLISEDLDSSGQAKKSTYFVPKSFVVLPELEREDEGEE